MLKAFFQILIFPGICFLFTFGLIGEYVDRKFYARFQNRVGPPWFQPLADFINNSTAVSPKYHVRCSVQYLC